MKERPILFTPDNIRAIIEGRKTQTRRILRNEAFHGCLTGDCPHEKQTECDACLAEWAKAKCPYGGPGDRLYIKEGVIIHPSSRAISGYYLDGVRFTALDEALGFKRYTAMFMPKWAARTWLGITEVRIERLHDISEEDAIAEGLRIHENPLCPIGAGRYMYTWLPGMHSEWELTAKKSYAALWDSINKKKHPWSSNPWVWALTFKRVQ